MEATPKRHINEVGPTGRQVGANLRRIRDARRMSTTAIAQAMAELGRPIQATAVTKIEKGSRNVSADELMCFAAVLGVNPSALLLPLVNDYTEIELTGFGSVLATLAWQWADGFVPTPKATRWTEADSYEFQRLARPEGRRHGPIVDPETPGWPARNAPPTERLVAQDILFARQRSLVLDLATWQARRAAVETSDATRDEKQMALEQIARHEREIQAEIERLQGISREIGLVSGFADKVGGQ